MCSYWPTNKTLVMLWSCGHKLYDQNGAGKLVSLEHRQLQQGTGYFDPKSFELQL